MTEKLTKELSSLSLSRFISLLAIVGSLGEDSKNNKNLELWSVLDKFKFEIRKWYNVLYVRGQLIVTPWSDAFLCN